jgi:hypothetical protein
MKGDTAHICPDVPPSKKTPNAEAVAGMQVYNDASLERREDADGRQLKKER